MDNKTMQNRIAYLESLNDQLITEISYVDQLLRMVGFSEGLKTVKSAAHELLNEQEEHEEQA